MKNLGLAVVSIFSFIIMGCEHTIEPDQKEKVLIQTSAPDLYITNNTDFRIYYEIVGRETAALIDWIPISDIRWSVAKDATVRISYEDIYREDDENEVIVYWWHAIRPGIRAAQDEIHSIVAKL